MKVIFARLILPVVLIIAATPWRTVDAQDQAPAGSLGLDRYFDYEEAEDAQIAPNGRQVIYTRERIDVMHDAWARELWLMDSDGSRHRFLTKGSNARWAPDGTRIAYIANDGNDQAQIFVRWMDAEGATSQVTHLTQAPTGIHWSPDSRQIAFRSLVEHRDEWKIDMPKAPKGAQWTEPARVIDSLHYRQDRRGFQPQGYWHLFVVSADGGAARQITQGQWHVGRRFSNLDGGAGIDWTPDGRNLVFDGAMESVDLYAIHSHINRVAVDSGESLALINGRGAWSNPVVSPNGRHIAYTGFGADKLDYTWAAAELWVMDIDGSNRRQLTQDSPDSPSGLHWAKDSKGIYFEYRRQGEQNLYRVNLDGKRQAITSGSHVLNITSFDQHGQAAGILSQATRPKDVVVFKLKNASKVQRLTDLNADLLHGITLSDYQEIRYTSADGTPVQGWVIKPPNFDPQQRYPLMLIIHGGPHAMYDVSFRYGWQNYAANGYVVVFTNPRGSTGYGTEFGNAIRNQYPGRGDYEDLMGGVDHVLDQGYVDSQRLYVSGCSGGGVLTTWTIAHTDRFAAAAALCPVTEWIAFAGQSDITAWAFKRFDQPFWEDPSAWLDHAPLMHVGKVSTPTLLMTGVQDLRTPMGQSESYYAALKARGVPTKLVQVNQEWHGTTSKPTNFLRTQLYIMSWWRQWTHGQAVIPEREAIASSDPGH